MTDPFQPVRDEIARGAKSKDPAERAGSKLLKGALASVIEFKKLIDAERNSEQAADIAVGLVDAIAMVMASLITHLPHEAAIALWTRLADSVGHVLRLRSEKQDVH
jgi:hypothetical protein